MIVENDDGRETNGGGMMMGLVGMKVREIVSLS